MYIHRQPKLGGGLGPSSSNKIRILPVTVAFCGCFLCPLCKFKAIRGRRGANFHTSVVVLHTRLQHWCESSHLDPLPWPRTALNLHKGHRKQPQKATLTGRLRLFWFYYWSPWFIEKAKIAISIPKLGPRLPPSLGCLWYIKIVCAFVAAMSNMGAGVGWQDKACTSRQCALKRSIHLPLQEATWPFTAWFSDPTSSRCSFSCDRHRGNTYLTSLPLVSGNTYLTSLPLISGNTYLTSLPLVSGNTYLTSLPLVSVRPMDA